MKSRAIALYGKEDMRLVELELPDLNDYDLIIRPLACGICGSDVRNFYKGIDDRHNLPDGRLVLGHEMSGEIVELGREAEGSFSIGDVVTIAPVAPCLKCENCYRGLQNLCKNALITGGNFNGGFSELMYVPGQMLQVGGVVKVPKELSYLAATFAEPVSCCLHGIEQTSLKIGDRILIMGDGSIGLIFLQLVKLMGAGFVTTTGHRSKRRELAAKLGADEALNANNVDLFKIFGDSFDIVIVATSNIAAAEEGQRLVRSGGELLLFSGYESGTMMNVDMNNLHYRQLSFYGGVDCTINEFHHAVKILPLLRLEELISNSWPLEKTIDAFRAAKDADVIKLVVEP